MHICFASLDYPLNGGASGVGAQTRALAQGLAARGVEVSVIMLSAASETEPLTDGAMRIYPTATTGLHWYIGKIPALGNLISLPVRELEYSVAVWRALRRVRADCPPDLIEATETGALFATLLTRQTPVLIRLHGEKYTFHKYSPELNLTMAVRLSRLFQRIALRRARVLMCPSATHAREIAAELRHRHPPLAVIPNMTRFNISPFEFRQREAATVLYVGRIEPLKGIRILLRAVAQVASVLPDVRFVFAGRFNSASFKCEFEQLVQRFGIEKQITLLGEVDSETLSWWYQRATIGVSPSYYETFGLAALEQMCFGLPVIGTRATGLSEIIQDGVTGLLIEPGDAAGLAAALIKLLEDPSLRAQMGRAAAERAQRFSVANVLPANEQLYAWVSGKIETEPGPHVFLSPHLDDVVLSCGGMIQDLIENKKPVGIVNVFSGHPQSKSLSAFARHLHAKWGLGEDAVPLRRQEDLAATQELGVSNPLYWTFLEAPYRRDRDNQPLYATYAEMRGALREFDLEMEQALSRQVQQLLESMPETTILYVPLALGQHVDHQILNRVGQTLGAGGSHVRFYEDYPYVENYVFTSDVFNWIPKTVPISASAKSKAAKEYTSQLRGLGGSPKSVAQRLENLSRQVDRRQPAERVWEYIPRDNESPSSMDLDEIGPLRLKTRKPGFRAWRKFVDTFRWHDLDELLPKGSGVCLDVGCGQGRHRAVIESRGYRWFGLERVVHLAQHIQGDAQRLGIASASVAAVTLWQALEYVTQPEQVFAEVARVLEAGGVFCGSVSFLEPLHGQTLYNLSPLLVERLLVKYDFADIEIRAGLNGFSLMLWTWLRRTGIPRVEKLALPLAFVGLALPAFCLFLFSWVSLRLGVGNGHTLRWLTERAPLEFAGHILFVARKRARATNCTSDS